MTTPNPQLIGAIYVRSASSASEDANALDAQRIQCEEYAAQDEAQIIKIYSDVGISGNSLPQQRPGLSALLEDAREGQFNILYLANLSRLGRQPEHLIDFIRQLRTVGVQIRAGEQSDLQMTDELLEVFDNLKKTMLRAQA